MKLIIAEKKSVGETIASVIGGMKFSNGYCENSEYFITWCNGHIIELCEPAAYGEKLPLPIIPSEWQFKVLESKVKQLGIIKELAFNSKVTELICATDAGREGECIFRYIYNFIGCTKPFKRLWTSSLEESAVKAALSNMKDSSDYDELFEAGFCRAKADWLVGMNLSRHYTRLYGFPENPVTHKKSLDYGRVMTPILQMIVERDDKVMNFVKEKYFTAELDCGTFTASSERIENVSAAEELANKCNGSIAVIKSVKRETKNQKPPKLFDLTTLQREANRKFGYTAMQTLDSAQSLYEDKLITYPRTDSQYITEDMENTANEVFEIICKYMPFAEGIQFTPNIKTTINNAKVSDHHALLPTGLIKDKNLDELPQTEKNILFLICTQLLLAVSDKYSYETMLVEVECENTIFTATGKKDISQGWKGIAGKVQKYLKGEQDEADKKETVLPDLSEGMTFDNLSAEISEHWTSPPKPYTEDTLLSAMETAGNNLYEIESGEDIEKKGLGTPATRAAAIEKIVDKGYIERKKKQLIPTEYGRKVAQAADERLKSPVLTVEWETKLQKIEKGEYSSEAFMSEINDYIGNLISSNNVIPDGLKGLFPQSERKSIGVCPKCGGNIYGGKYGYYCEHNTKDSKSCNFCLRFEDNFFKWKNVQLTEKMAKEFLEKGKTFVKNMTAKSGNKFDGFIVLDTSGEYANFKVELDNSGNELCKCPKCGGTVVEDKFSFHCENAKGNSRTCNVYLKKDDNFFTWKSVTLGKTNAKELLTKGKTHISGLKSKTGSLYNADVILDTSGQYVQYKMELSKGGAKNVR